MTVTFSAQAKAGLRSVALYIARDNTGADGLGFPGTGDEIQYYDARERSERHATDHIYWELLC